MSPLTNYQQLKGDLTNIIVGDFNGDGFDDFIRQEKGRWDNNNKNTAQIFLSDGDGTFTVQLLTNSNSLKGDLTKITVLDVNGDGNDDFIRQADGAANNATSTAELFLSDGDGTFSVTAITRGGSYQSLRRFQANIIVGDFDGDGNDDFIRQEKGWWDNDNKNTANIFLSNGDGTFTKHNFLENERLPWGWS